MKKTIVLFLMLAIFVASAFTIEVKGHALAPVAGYPNIVGVEYDMLINDKLTAYGSLNYSLAYGLYSGVDVTLGVEYRIGTIKLALADVDTSLFDVDLGAQTTGAFYYDWEERKMTPAFTLTATIKLSTDLKFNDFKFSFFSRTALGLGIGKGLKFPLKAKTGFAVGAQVGVLFKL